MLQMRECSVEQGLSKTDYNDIGVRDRDYQELLFKREKRTMDCVEIIFQFSKEVFDLESCY